MTTGDSRGSDFEGEAFITLQGYSGTTEEIKIVKPGRAKSSFARAETATFILRGVDVGYIYNVIVRIVSAFFPGVLGNGISLWAVAKKGVVRGQAAIVKRPAFRMS